MVVPPGGPADVDGNSTKASDGRETWGRGADFLLSIIGFAVDLANVWRFPYLCYRNGGGAFLIPYTLMMIFGAVPLFYMELILGQYNRQGPISVWRWQARPPNCPGSTVTTHGTPNHAWSPSTPSRWQASTPAPTHPSIWGYAVLEMQKSSGLHELGYPKWQLVICLLFVYSMLYLSLFKGVWVDAAVQIFYSVGAGFGVHLSYASYNTFHNNCLRDCLVTTAVNCFTSFFSGFVIFTYLGFMSHKQGIPISNVATEGPGLVFQVYPEAVATLPGSHFWSMLFFFMLIMLGVDSAMGGMECVITGLMDEFQSFFHGRRFAREIFTLGAAIVSFSIALINVTPGGIYMFHVFDTYAAGISLLCSALFEAIAVSWFYGLERFSQDGVVMFGLLYQQPLKYNDYLYPSWAEWIGWSLALSSILMIPLVALISIIQTPGTLKERIAINISPVEEHESIEQTHIIFQVKPVVNR
ncbi:Sodium-dependent noradrenaline transporter [Blattella germanica]|nr:Sodium-dependent noradrenaline transporter [Blattella germanica]